MSYLEETITEASDGCSLPSDNISGSSGMSKCPCPPRVKEKTWGTEKILTWFLMSDLDETSYNEDKTSSQTISLIDESNCYITKQGLT